MPGDPAVIAAGGRFLRVFGPSFGFLGLQLAIIGVFRAAGKMVVTMVLALLSQWVVQFPLAYALGKHTHYGLDGLWFAFPTSVILVTIVAVVFFIRGDWKQSRLTDDQKFAEQVTEEVLVEEGGR